jgi:hypothetical protein
MNQDEPARRLMRWQSQAHGSRRCGRLIAASMPGRAGVQRLVQRLGFRPSAAVPGFSWAAGTPGWIPWQAMAGLNLSRLASSPDPTPVVVTWGRASCRDSTPIVLSGENDAARVLRAYHVAWIRNRPRSLTLKRRARRGDCLPVYISRNVLPASGLLFLIPILHLPVLPVSAFGL